MKLLWLIALGCIAWKMMSGRWPWEKKLPRNRADGQSFALAEARATLGVPVGADRQTIIEAHKRRLALVHPDRGGSNEQVHAANDARDLLLAGLEPEIPA